MARTTKYLGKSDLYKGVSKVIQANDKTRFQFVLTIKGARITGFRDTEREAALAYDMVLINHNMQPVNILKKQIKP